MPSQCHHHLQQLLRLAPENWLQGPIQGQDFDQIAGKQLNQFHQFFQVHHRHPHILLVESDPVQFLASFIAAVTAHCPIFLGNPNWGTLEWQQVFEQIQPDLILGQVPVPWTSVEPRHHSTLDHFIMIPTGGTSGNIKFAVHTWKTLTASVQGFQQFFQRSPIHSYCLLPLYHVSGLMQFIRSFTTGGQFVIQPFKAVESGQWYPINPAQFFISLVPTQLQRLLNRSETAHWLSQFQTVLLGGAPAWPALLEQARAYQIPLAPTYGMTETASQIATLKPKEFLAGYQNSGQILPHAKVKICNADGQVLGRNQTGFIQVEGHSLIWGYYQPQLQSYVQFNAFQTDDLGVLDQQGYLTIIGRNSDKIITGGEKVFPAEIEALIQATGKVKAVCVIGIPDQYWGQVVAAIYVPFNSSINGDDLKIALMEKISRYKLPKIWLAVDQIPQNPQGKVNRSRLKDQISRRLTLGVRI